MKNESNDDGAGWSARSERLLRDRHQHLLELRLLEILQQHALGALLGDDALVVRQVERGGLHAVVAVAGREHDVDDADRRVAAELGAAELRLDRQVVLQVLQLAAEALELACVSSRSVSVMNDSNAALKLNHSSSYTSYGPIVGSMDASSSIHATSLA